MRISEWFTLVGILSLPIIAITLLITIQKEEVDLLKAVQNGEIQLSCDFAGRGFQPVPPEKVVDLWEGRWYFVNGSATQCFTYERS